MPRSIVSLGLVLAACAGSWAGLAWAARRMGGGETMFANHLVEIGGLPYCATATDIDHDGITDLITSSETEHGGLTVFLGRGDDVLLPAQHIDMGWKVEAVRAADFNGDGRDDLLVVQDGRVSVLLAVEGGSFSPPNEALEVRLEDGMLRSPAVADLDGDGILDVAVPDVMAGSVQILRGLGDGSLVRQGRLAAGKRPWSVAAGDFNGDGRNDIATVNIESHDLSILYGREGGGFADEQRVPLGGWTLTIPGSYYTHAIAAGDLNGDGLADLVVAHQDVGVVTVHFGSAHGTPTPGGEMKAPDSALTPIIADLNGDGKMDILVGASSFLGDGKGTFAPRRSSGVCDEPGAEVTGRFDADSIPDLAVACQRGSAAGVFRGNGDGTFGPPSIDMVPEPVTAITASAFKRGSGALVAFASLRSDQVIVMGDFVDGAPRRRTRYQVGWNPTSLTTGCFTRRGQMDLAVAVRNFDPVTDGPSETVVGGAPRPIPPPPKGEVVVFQGRDDGTFAAPVRLTVGYRPAVVKAVDLNGDGLDDLLVASQGEKRIEAPGSVSAFLADKAGGFGPERRLLEGLAFSALAVADFNGDGRLDLATGVPGEDRMVNGVVAVSFGSGDGSFGAAHTLDATWGGGCLVSGDFDGDGRPDLVEVNRGSVGWGPLYAHGATVIYSSRADGTFDRRMVEAGPPLCVEVNDFNGDRRPDLAVLNWSHEISILLGDPGGSFEPRLRFATAGPADPFTAADLDGDGRADLSAGVPHGISILMNRGDRRH